MSRLAIEVKSGVFVSNANARIREKIWLKIVDKWDVAAIMLYSTNTEQGYKLCSHGNPDREILDFDGIQLLSKPLKKKK